jgi:hypothetical protein
MVSWFLNWYQAQTLTFVARVWFVRASSESEQRPCRRVFRRYKLAPPSALARD